MTREEAINQLQDAKDGYEEYLTAEAIEMAIKALSQEPCDDAISRETVIDTLQYAWEANKDIQESIVEIKALPSVTQKCEKCAMNGSGSKYCDNCGQKSGKWITDRCDMYICSKCNHTYTDLSGERYGMNYCPNCGVKMESEDKK